MTIKNYIFLVCILFSQIDASSTLPENRTILTPQDFPQVGVEFIDTVDPKSITPEMHAYFKEEAKKLNNCQLWGKKYEAFEKSAHKPLIYVKYIDSTIGYGLFAGQLIKKDTIIGQYAGKMVEMSSYAKNNICCDYLHECCGKYGVDAKKMGNMTRFINCGGSNANVCSRKAYLPGKGSFIVIAARRDIRPGEQVLTNYGSTYWRNRMPKKLS